MDGQPLPRPHGAPVRLVVPRMYGYKSVKWVTRIEVRNDLQPGYWEQRGYDADAWIGDSNGL
jgi:DMSO/TMAO reductase YedYZ molybdopterin-dependent catalytic subunit